MESGDHTDVIYLDFSKAFDKVSHKRLIYKLETYGVEGRILGWIKDFLSNRSQRVVVDGHASPEAAVTSGVPQGSVLGPMLFLIYIKDISDETNSHVKLFADDSKLYRTQCSDLDHNL